MERQSLLFLPVVSLNVPVVASQGHSVWPLVHSGGFSIAEARVSHSLPLLGERETPRGFLWIECVSWQETQSSSLSLRQRDLWPGDWGGGVHPRGGPMLGQPHPVGFTLSSMFTGETAEGASTHFWEGKEAQFSSWSPVSKTGSRSTAAMAGAPQHAVLTGRPSMVMRGQADGPGSAVNRQGDSGPGSSCCQAG